MSKIDYDVSDVEAGANLEAAPIGVFPAKITKFIYENPDDKDERFVVTAEITDPTGKYFPFTDYIMYASPTSKFRWRQFLDACKLPAKGQVDDVKNTVGGKSIIGAKCQIRVKHEKYNDETRAKIGIWLPTNGAASGGSVEREAEPTGEEARSWETIGTAIDIGEEAEDELRAAAVALDIDPDSIGTWQEVGALVDAGAPEPDEPAVAEEPSATYRCWAIIGGHVDAGEKSDDVLDQFTATLNEAAEVAGLDPNSYETWEELGAVLDTKEGVANDAPAEEPEDLNALAAILDAGDEDAEGYAEAEAQLRGLAALVDGLEPDEVGTWAEVVELITDASGGGGTGVDYASMGLVELKAKCRDKEISPTGTKEELVKRLSDYDATDPFSGE